MKRFLVVYSIFALLIGISLYFVTIVVVTSNRNQAVYDEITSSSAENNDFDDFIKYQSIGYKKISQIETDDYYLHIYHIISQSDERVFQQLVWILRPINDVTHAESINDENDQTRIILYDTSDMSVIYESNTDAAYKDFAMSSGIANYGFIVFAPELDETMSIGYEIFDYEGLTIIESNVIFEHHTYDPNDLGQFSPSFTSQEKDDLLNVGAYFPQALVQNYTVYILVVLILGFLIFQLKKKDWN
jgi:hypothetical protein